MHFSSIITALTLAMVATAAPNDGGDKEKSKSSSVAATMTSAGAPKSSAGATHTSAAATQPSGSSTCSSSQVASCCNNSLNVVGISCVTITLLDLLGLTCPQSSSIACCSTSGTQNGLVNVGTICVPVSVVL